jgi:hypothetical protein
MYEIALENSYFAPNWGYDELFEGASSHEHPEERADRGRHSHSIGRGVGG